MSATGNGLCPVEPDHGRLLMWEDGRWYCPARAHETQGSPFFRLTYEDGKQVYSPSSRVDTGTSQEVPSGKRKRERTA